VQTPFGLSYIAYSTPYTYYRVKHFWEKPVQKLKIGELALRSGCHVETIRFYEKEGLLPLPPRSAGNYRLYGDAHVERLTFIRHCRSLDMTLDEIRTLLRFQDAPDGECGEVNALLDAHIRHVTTRIRELKALKRQLVALRCCCAMPRSVQQCGVLQGQAEPDRVVAGPYAGAAHVRGTRGLHVNDGKDV
jgi:Cd(II)/Pb(II)-responsive transcriptional regulator